MKRWTQEHVEARHALGEVLRARNTPFTIGYHPIPGYLSFPLLDGLGLVIVALTPRVGRQAALGAVIDVLRAGRLT